MGMYAKKKMWVHNILIFSLILLLMIDSTSDKKDITLLHVIYSKSLVMSIITLLFWWEKNLWLAFAEISKQTNNVTLYVWTWKPFWHGDQDDDKFMNSGITNEITKSWLGIYCHYFICRILIWSKYIWFKLSCKNEYYLNFKILFMIMHVFINNDITYPVVI